MPGDYSELNRRYISTAHKHHEHYTREELLYILNSTLSAKQIARRLGRTPNAIGYVRYRLKQRGIENFNSRKKDDD